MQMLFSLLGLLNSVSDTGSNLHNALIRQYMVSEHLKVNFEPQNAHHTNYNYSLFLNCLIA